MISLAFLTAMPKWMSLTDSVKLYCLKNACGAGEVSQLVVFSCKRENLSSIPRVNIKNHTIVLCICYSSLGKGETGKSPGSMGSKSSLSVDLQVQ